MLVRRQGETLIQLLTRPSLADEYMLTLPLAISIPTAAVES
jgi:hypothetical protein